MNDTVRAKLLTGRLRHDRHETTWAGKGNGSSCDGCDRAIADTDVEIEVDFPDHQTLRFHQSCFEDWCSQAAEV